MAPDIGAEPDVIAPDIGAEPDVIAPDIGAELEAMALDIGAALELIAALEVIGALAAALELLLEVELLVDDVVVLLSLPQALTVRAPAASKATSPVIRVIFTQILRVSSSRETLGRTAGRATTATQLGR